MLERQSISSLKQDRQTSSTRVDFRSLLLHYTNPFAELFDKAHKHHRHLRVPVSLGTRLQNAVGECGRRKFRLGFGGDLVGVGLVVEQLGVSAAADGDAELLLRITGTEPRLKEVEEELGPPGTVRAVVQSVTGGAYQRRTGACWFGENLFADLAAQSRAAMTQSPNSC
jgi:hypothetical protein